MTLQDMSVAHFSHILSNNPVPNHCCYTMLRTLIHWIRVQAFWWIQIQVFYDQRLGSFTSVSDPHWFNADPDTDPDPAFFLIADPDSGSGFRIRIPDPDPDPGFDDLKLKKCTTRNIIFIFLVKNCNLLIPRPPKRTPKLQEKPSAHKREHPALQKMKILSFFLFFWDIFALLDPDPDPQFVCGSGSGSSSSNQCGSMRIRIRIRNPEFYSWEK